MEYNLPPWTSSGYSQYIGICKHCGFTPHHHYSIICINPNGHEFIATPQNQYDILFDIVQNLRNEIEQLKLQIKSHNSD